MDKLLQADWKTIDSSSMVSINVEPLPAGYYFFKTILVNEVITHKFLKN